MNIKVYKVSLALCVIFLLANNIVKIFKPEMYVMAITNENLILVGNFIDTHLWAYFICSSVFGFITYYLYTCACACRVIKCYWIFALISVLDCFIAINFIQNYTHFAVSFMLFLPLINKANLENTFIIFFIHGFNQIISLELRNYALNIGATNYA